MILNDLKVVALCFTNNCNLCCVHCGNRTSNNKQPVPEKPASFFADVCAQAKRLGAIQFNMSGGEIFVREDCFDLIESALNLELFVSIESNGTLLDNDRIGRLSDYGDQIRLSISLDGFSSESNDLIRGFGSFDKTMTALQRISRTDIPVRVITVLHEGNLQEIPEMACFVADSLGMGYRLIPSIMEYGRGVYACSQIGAKWDQINRVLDGFFYDFLRERQDDRHSVELNMALVPIDVEYHHICPWGSSMIGLGPDGSVGLCHVGISDERFVFGDLTSHSLESIWNGSGSLKAYRAITGHELKGICGNCLAQEVCRGGCRVHAISKYGEMYAPSPQCQTVYELGGFPDYAMRDPEFDCSYSRGIQT